MPTDGSKRIVGVALVTGIAGLGNWRGQLKGERMAAADYRLCDKCNRKAFYDANLNYDFSTAAYKIPENEKVRDNDYKLDSLGDWTVLCRDCAKMYKCVIEKL